MSARRDTRRHAYMQPHSYGIAPQGRGMRVARQQRGANSDFVEFLHRLLDMAFFPITYPLKLIRDILTSPLTISVVLKLVLVVVLVAVSAAFSILAVGAFWWSWGTGGAVEVEGWLTYGSRTHRTPHALLALPTDRFQEDLPYDVQVEMELVRPSPGAEEMGNFMVTLDLRSSRDSEVILYHAAQPSLPPMPLPTSLIGLPQLPSVPCIIPWPFRGLCPSRLFSYGGNPGAKIKERRRKGTLASPAKGNEVVVLTKELLEGITMRPGRGDQGVAVVFVSIGREDSFPDERPMSSYYREVRTTGWVVVRFIPHPTGLRWLLTANPIPPLLILPPVSLTLTIASALLGFIVISCCGKRKPAEKPTSSAGAKALKIPKVEPSSAIKRERIERPEISLDTMVEPTIHHLPHPDHSDEISERTLTEGSEVTETATDAAHTPTETETESASWDST